MIIQDPKEDLNLKKVLFLTQIRYPRFPDQFRLYKWREELHAKILIPSAECLPSGRNLSYNKQ